ncbi:MAG: PKD domain-containing protein [Bacteroidales bacterium]|nr:PKD domain-containing protein [Bacteroidales bacterium]
MKKFLLSAIAIFAMSLCSFAQIPVCQDACEPHANDADYSTGVIPTYPTAFAPLTVGVPVDECISIKIPSQISGSAISSALSWVTLSITSITANELVNLPDGLTACASANPMYANNTYTLRITGTPTTPGTYNLNMRAELEGGTGTSLANTYTNGTNGVSTNITITVVEAGDMAANFSTTPSATGMLTQAVHINEGETVTFADLSTGADHIAWTFEGGSPATSTDANVTVTYATAGTYTATLTAYNADESQSDSKSVTIEVSEVVIDASFTTDPAASGLFTQSVTIEQGQTITYTNTSTNAHHIAWSFQGGDPTTSTNNEVTVTYNTVGTFTTELVAYNEDETDSDAATLTVTVNVSAENAVTADFTTDPEATNMYVISYIAINQGETVTFTNASTNAHHIAWTFESGSPATSTEDVVTVTYAEASDTYFTATLTAYNEDETISDTKSVYVRVASNDPNAVEASFTTDPAYTDLYITRMLTIETGTTVTYTSTCSENTDHISWNFEGGSPATSTENVVSVTYSTAGSYTTTLTAYSADGTNTDEFTLSVTVTDPVAVEENAISEISVYPNPTSSIINIAAEGMQNITIIDMTGRVVMSKDVNSNFETISAEGFAKANYMVRIATADGVVVKNIVVE